MVRQLVGRLARCPALLPLIPCLLAGWSAPAMGGTGPQIVDIAPPASAGVVDQNGLGSVRLTMSEPVDAAPGSVVAWGVAGGPLSLTTSWDEASLVLTVTFALPVHSDRVTLLVGPGVTNLLGEPLDGEVPSPLTAVLPTGDGDPGGIAAFRFDVLQGDVNRDGTTDAADMPLLLEALGSCALQTPEDLNFNSDADLNNDGCVNVLDVQVLGNREQGLNLHQALRVMDIDVPSTES